MTDNVILFPGFKREAPPQTVEEIVDKVTQTRKEHVDGVVNDLIPDIIHVFGTYGQTSHRMSTSKMLPW